MFKFGVSFEKLYEDTNKIKDGKHFLYFKYYIFNVILTFLEFCVLE